MLNRKADDTLSLGSVSPPLLTGTVPSPAAIPPHIPKQCPLPNKPTKNTVNRAETSTIWFIVPPLNPHQFPHHHLMAVVSGHRRARRSTHVTPGRQTVRFLLPIAAPKLRQPKVAQPVVS